MARTDWRYAPAQLKHDDVPPQPQGKFWRDSINYRSGLDNYKKFIILTLTQYLRSDIYISGGFWICPFMNMNVRNVVKSRKRFKNFRTSRWQNVNIVPAGFTSWFPRIHSTWRGRDGTSQTMQTNQIRLNPPNQHRKIQHPRKRIPQRKPLIHPNKYVVKTWVRTGGGCRDFVTRHHVLTFDIPDK